MKKSNWITAMSGAVWLTMGPIACATDNHSAGEILDDTVVTTQVKSSLIADPVTKAHQISVVTYKGTVKLSGFVDSPEAEHRAVDIAKGVKGAMKVEDELQVRK